jgi:hypothetical protein
MFEPENMNELKDLNNLQAGQEVLPDGEYGFEKEGFEADDFNEDGADKGDDEADWGEAEDFGGAPTEGAEEVGAGKFRSRMESILGLEWGLTSLRHQFEWRNDEHHRQSASRVQDSEFAQDFEQL